MSEDRSPATRLIDALVASVGKRCARQVLDVALDKLSIVELAALAHDWRGMWARPKQLPPETAWRSWGQLTGRGFGKTRSDAEHINEEVLAGRAPSIGLAAQNEEKSIDLQVVGQSGLIATSPPWCKARFVPSDMMVLWPNGAVAKILTPEKPGNVRGHEFHLAWLSELQSWPATTREEAFMNFMFATRLGYARTIWDATPKHGHPILRMLLERAAENPDTHHVVRGTIHENAANLGDGVVEELERSIGGTAQGDEELLGKMSTTTENAIVKDKAWIDGHRRPMPTRFARRGLGVDPAVTSRRGSDRTGIVDAGVGIDGQGYVIADLSGKHDAPTWGALVVDRVMGAKLDVVVVETNKGGNLLTQNLRAVARDRGVEVIVLGEKDRPMHQPGKIFVREIYSRGEKAERARPLSTAYERGLISHVIGAPLTELEQTLTTWEPTPGARSPDDLDAETHILVELLELKDSPPDLSRGFVGIGDVSRALRTGTPTPTSVAQAILRGGASRGRI